MRSTLSSLLVGCVAALTPGAWAQITAQSYDTPSYVQFSAPHFQVAAGETNAVVTVVRTGDYRTSASVSYATHEGTAEPTLDFEPCGGTLQFPAGQSFKTISIPVVRNGQPLPKTFTVELSSATAAVVVTQATAEVEIQPEAPALLVQVKKGGLQVSWPDSGEPYKLETQIDGSWSAVTNSAVLVQGEWIVSMDTSKPVALFRLRLDSLASN